MDGLTPDQIFQQVQEIVDTPYQSRPIRVLNNAPKSEAEAKQMFRFCTDDLYNLCESRIAYLQENDTPLYNTILGLCEQSYATNGTVIFSTNGATMEEIDTCLKQQSFCCTWSKVPFCMSDPLSPDYPCTDAISTGFGESAELLRDDTGKLIKNRQRRCIWIYVPGLANNFQLVTHTMKRMKCAFEDRWKTVLALHDSASWEEIQEYYRGFSWNECDDIMERRKMSWDTSLARYLYKDHVPDCDLVGAGSCGVCHNEVSAFRVYNGSCWIRACYECYYPQVKALKKWENAYRVYIEHGDLDEVACASVMNSRPKFQEYDVLQHVRAACEMIQGQDM